MLMDTRPPRPEIEVNGIRGRVQWQQKEEWVSAKSVLQEEARLFDPPSEKTVECHLLEALRREKLLRGIVTLANQSFNPDHLLSRAAHEIGSFFKADRCLAIQYDYDNANPGIRLRLSAQYHASSDLPFFKEEDSILHCFQPEAWQEPVKEGPWVIHASNPRSLLRQIKQQLGSSCSLSALKREFERYRIQALLGTGIYYRGTPYGGLLLHHCRDDRQWKKEEIGLLKEITSQIGAVFHRAELYMLEQQARQEADAANHRKDQFLATLSHEFRTPLNAIIGYSEMLERGMAGDISKKQLKYAHNIAVSGHHLLSLVSELLDIAKIGAGRMTLSLECVQIEPFIREIKDIIDELALQKRIQLSIHIQPGLDCLMADPARLKQIFFNLLSNAVKFNREEGTILIRLSQSRDRKWMVGQIKDNGIGIPKEKLPKVFTRFFQVDGSSTAGTGLGLAVTKHLVELHGGSIQVESQEGAGSTFTFKLPLHTSGCRED